jgi:hypothetical protein
VPGQLDVRETGDEVSQRNGLIDQHRVVRQEQRGDECGELGLAQRRAERAEGVSLQADALPEARVASGVGDVFAPAATQDAAVMVVAVTRATCARIWSEFHSPAGGAFVSPASATVAAASSSVR